MFQYVALHKSNWTRLTLTGLLVYALICLVLALMQRQLMYFPDQTPYQPAAWDMPELQPVTIQTADGLTLTHFHAAPRDQQKTIVFFQGNAGSPGWRNFKIRSWLDAGYGVWQVVYRGYGGNPGRPAEAGLYQDARAALHYLQEQIGVTPANTVLYGESLGTGVAVQMATEYSVAGIILESPYSSTVEVAEWRYPLVPVSLLMQDRYDSIAKMSAIEAPLFLVHGTADHVIPVDFGKRLFAAAHEPKQASFVRGRGHNDIFDNQVRDKVLNFIDQLGHTQSAHSEPDSAGYLSVAY